MWRTLASLERIPPAAKARLGEVLLERLEAGGTKLLGGLEQELVIWALGRLGARSPLHGPADAVVAPDVAARWIERLLSIEWRSPDKAAFPVAQLGRRTGDRARDVPDETRATLAARLRAVPGGERTARLVEEVVALEAREERVAFGDSLPTGLKLAAE
jgi:hypothetical protein